MTKLAMFETKSKAEYDELVNKFMSDASDDEVAVLVALGLPNPRDIPRPGETSGWDLRDWDQWAKRTGFEELDRSTHSFQYAWPKFKTLRIGLSTSPSDKRSHMNAAQDLRVAWRASCLLVIEAADLIERRAKIRESLKNMKEGSENRARATINFTMMSWMDRADAELDGAADPDAAIISFVNKMLDDPQVLKEMSLLESARLSLHANGGNVEKLEQSAANALNRLDREFKVSRAAVAARAGITGTGGRVQLSTLSVAALVGIREAADEMYDELDAKREAAKAAKLAERERREAERAEQRSSVDALKARQFVTEDGHWRKTDDPEEGRLLCREYRVLAQRVVSEASQSIAKAAADLSALTANLRELDLPVADASLSTDLQAAQARVTDLEQQIVSMQAVLKNGVDAVQELERLKKEHEDAKALVALADDTEKDTREQLKKLVGMVQKMLAPGDALTGLFHARNLESYIKELDPSWKPSQSSST